MHIDIIKECENAIFQLINKDWEPLMFKKWYQLTEEMAFYNQLLESMPKKIENICQHFWCFSFKIGTYCCKCKKRIEVNKKNEKNI